MGKRDKLMELAGDVATAVDEAFDAPPGQERCEKLLEADAVAGDLRERLTAAVKAERRFEERKRG